MCGEPTWKSKDMSLPDRGYMPDEMELVQTPERIAEIEGREWYAIAWLAEFSPKDPQFLWLHFLKGVNDGTPEVTPHEWLEGTRWAGCPFHVTLGQPPDDDAKEQLKRLFPKPFYCSIQLRKWSRRNRAATAYLVSGGTLVGHLRAAEDLGLRPRGAWHISL